MLSMYLGSEDAVNRFCDSLLSLRELRQRLDLPVRLAKRAVSKFCDAVDLAASCLDVATDNAQVLQDANKQVISGALQKLQEAVENSSQTLLELVEVPKVRWIVAVRRYCDTLADVTFQV